MYDHIHRNGHSLTKAAPLRLPSARACLLLTALPATALLPAPGAAQEASAPDRATVVLLHGLGRTPLSMRPMERSLEEEGFRVVNLGYPSRREPMDALVDSLGAALAACCAEAERIHFVTHSLGGILVRSYVRSHGAARIGRVVMLSPPNAGSEVVDRLEGLGALEWLLGPTFAGLGTDSTALPARLGPPEFEVGVITGERSVNPLFSRWLPGPDDGAVTVESARLPGAAAFLVVPYSHTFIMRKEEVIEQVTSFLRSGRFVEAAPAVGAREGPQVGEVLQ